MLLVDTGVLLAAADNTDPAHDVCSSLLAGEPGPLVASPLVIAEAADLIGRQLGALAEARFMRAVADGDITMDTLTDADLRRVAELVDQYSDLGLGATDASVVALAERHDQDPIATLDRRRRAQRVRKGVRAGCLHEITGSGSSEADGASDCLSKLE